MRLIDADALKKTLVDWIIAHYTDTFTGDDAGLVFAYLINRTETIDKGDKEINFDEKAVEIVRDYILDHLDKSDPTPIPDFQVYTVWKCKILQNWKYLLSSTVFDGIDGIYYELTYNGDKHEWYLDAYKKFQNVVVKDDGEAKETK